VLRLPAATQRVVLAGGALVAGHVLPTGMAQRDRAGDPIWAVLGHLDRRLPAAVLIHRVAGLDAIQRVAQSARGTIADRPDDLVHPPATGMDKRLLAQPKDRGQPVGAVARVLARPAVIEHGDLLADIRVEAIGLAVGALLIAKAHARMAAIAERLYLRAAAATQRHLWSRGILAPEPVHQAPGIRDQVGAILLEFDRHLQARLQAAQLAPQGRASLRSLALGSIQPEGLQRRRRLQQLRRRGAGAGTQGGGADGQLPERRRFGRRPRLPGVVTDRARQRTQDRVLEPLRRAFRHLTLTLVGGLRRGPDQVLVRRLTREEQVLEIGYFGRHH